MNIKDDISNIKEKINNEIEALRFYQELSYVCDLLKREIDCYKYDANNEFELKKYKGFLEDFLDNKIGYINSLIVKRTGNSVFDNRDKENYEKLEEIKNDISNLLSYIENNFPVIGKNVSQEFEKINKYYENELKDAFNSSKRRFNVDIGINKEPVLSVYCDTSSVLRSYINSLNAFKTTYVDNIKIIVDNDIKVKELFKRAYETLKEPRVIVAVKELESNYINEINKSMNSISVNSNILLIQDNMIKNGLQLDKIIDIEKAKNTNYQKIVNIDFNYNNIDELLEIEDYVNREDIFKEEFYKVLYALIEKEKYIYYKYNVLPKIYNRIKEKSRIIIEKMFLERIKDLNDYEKEEIVINLKKNGFLKVMDYKYKEMFDGHNFTIQSSYDKELISDDNTLYYKHDKKGLSYPCFDIINKKTGKRVEHIYGTKNNEETLVRFGDIYRFCAHQIKTFGDKDIIYYYTIDGKKIRPFKDNSKIIKKVLDYYIVYNKDGEIIVDSNFNKIMDLHTFNIHRDMLVDYTYNNILIYDSCRMMLSLYDNCFNLLKEIPISNVICVDNNPIISLNSETNMFNDGVVSILVNDTKDKYICYYDVINDKKIDFFKIISDTSLYGYSEGLYPFYDHGKIALGYKNINGDIVLEPNYLQANPFFGGCAQVVKSLSIAQSFINYNGDITEKHEIFDYGNNFIRVNSSKKQYEVLCESDKKHYIIRANNYYSIDISDKIINLDLNENTNKKLLKKEQ